jgi:hypothetical protein
MKRLIVTFFVLPSGVATAVAGSRLDDHYDLVRTNRHPRSEACFQAGLNYCYYQTGAAR